MHAFFFSQILNSFFFLTICAHEGICHVLERGPMWMTNTNVLRRGGTIKPRLFPHLYNTCPLCQQGKLQRCNTILRWKTPKAVRQEVCVHIIYTIKTSVSKISYFNYITGRISCVCFQVNCLIDDLIGNTTH